MKTLREYQNPQVNKLIRQLQNANEAALISAVGTGKTIVTAVVGDELIKRGIVKKVIVSAPFNTIVKEFPDLSGKKFLSGVANNAQYLIGKIDKSENIKHLIDVITGNSSEFLSTSHHAMANHRVRTAVNQADDLSDLLLVIDEAHHCFTSDDEDENKDGTLLGEIADKIKQKGGKILYVTATPYRTVGNQTNLIFDPLKCNPVIRTIGEQMRDGYAPSLNTEYIHVRDVKLINGGIAGIFGDLLTTRISDPQLKTLLPRIIKQWKAEKYPKTIMLVPAGNADHTAQEVKKYLEEITFPSNVASVRGRKHPSVLISVGDSGSVIEFNGKEMSEIEYDKANNGHIYDIVIGCRKFDEGTDVSSASHIFMVGLPSSVRLFHQRTGRVLRDKKNIEGYAEWFGTEWVDKSKVVFFAPIGKKTKEFDYKVGRQLLHCIFAAESYQEYCESLNASQNIRIAFEDKHKKAKAEATRAELEEVMALLGNIELNELKDYSSNEYNELVKESLNPDMTVGERIDMIKSSTMSDAERVIALNNIINHLPDDIKGKIDWDAIVNSIVKSVKKKKVAGFDVPPTSAISDVFDDVLREFYSVKITTNTERAVQQVFSSLSGETFKEWAEKCSQFMGEDNGLMWINKICDYIDEHGFTPTDVGDANSLATKLFRLRSSKSGLNDNVFYPSYDVLVGKRGYPDLLNQINHEDDALKWINNICDYIDKYGRNPPKSERELYFRLHGFRAYKQDKGNGHFHDSYQKLIESRGYPTLFDINDLESGGINWLSKICDFIDDNGKPPAQSSIDKYEKSLGGKLQQLKQSKSGNKNSRWYDSYQSYAESRGYPKLLNIISGDNRNQMYINIIKDICAFVNSNGCDPKKQSSDIHEATLGKHLHRMRGWKDSNSHKWTSGYEKIAIDCGCSELFIKKTSIEYRIKIACDNVSCICDFIDTHKKLPTRSSSDEYEKQLASILHNFRNRKKNNEGIYTECSELLGNREYPNLFDIGWKP